MSATAMVLLTILAWTLFAFVGISLCHWMSVKKEWMRFPDPLWKLMLVTLFLPWTLWALSVLVLYHYKIIKR